MELLVITGVSGAGKSKAMAALEDLGYYCLDNIPPALIESFAAFCIKNEDKIKKAAIVTDGRAAEKFDDFVQNILDLKAKGMLFKLIFLDAQDSVLLKRFKETRRPHIFAEYGHGNIMEAIAYERNLLNPLRVAADFVVDTSVYLPSQLKEHLIDIFEHGRKSDLSINVLSFGFKHGLPEEADLVFDVRSFKNPFYNDTLRDKTGLDQEVRDCVMSDPDAIIFSNNLINMLNHLIPCYIKEGRASLTIAIGCTGGHHRSVTLVELIADHIQTHLAHCVKTHRDIKR